MVAVGFVLGALFNKRQTHQRLISDAKRKLIDNSFEMLDCISRLRSAGKLNRPLFEAIPETNEYHRIESYLSEKTKSLMIREDIVVWDPSGLHTRETLLLSGLYREIAALEQKWGLA